MDEKNKSIDQKEIEKHPELVPIIKEKKSISRFERRKKHISNIKMIQNVNKPYFTYIMFGYAIILGLVHIFFGVMSILTIFGISNQKIWNFYSSTWIFGWEKLAITGFVLIIVGIIILWSIPYYLMNSIQKADSYLTIGSGISILFGIIYILIIIADIISCIIDCVSVQQLVTLETYFYVPIMLGILIFPIFRVQMIRHIVLPPLEEDTNTTEIKEESEKPIFKFHQGKFRRKWRKHDHWKGRKFRKRK